MWDVFGGTERREARRNYRQRSGMGKKSTGGGRRKKNGTSRHGQKEETFEGTTKLSIWYGHTFEARVKQNTRCQGQGHEYTFGGEKKKKSHTPQ